MPDPDDTPLYHDRRLQLVAGWHALALVVAGVVADHLGPLAPWARRVC
ncbi:hypothetical protein [Haloarchaeobius baliensis]